jgi:hypothetical protein
MPFFHGTLHRASGFLTCELGVQDCNLMALEIMKPCYQSIVQRENLAARKDAISDFIVQHEGQPDRVQQFASAFKLKPEDADTVIAYTEIMVKEATKIGILHE